MRRSSSLIVLLFLFCSPEKSRTSTKKPKQRVVFIAFDGIRTKEFFQGTKSMTPKQLMPFLHGELKDKPNYILLGNTYQKEKPCTTSNPYYWSLPGYADTLAGRRQSSVTGNYFIGTVKYPTIFDKLQQTGLSLDQVGIFTSWNQMKYIVMQSRNPEYNPLHLKPKRHTRHQWFDYMVMDSFEKHVSRKTRFNYVIFSAGDTWAHLGNWEKYIQSIRIQDEYTKRIFRRFEKMDPNTTSYVVFTDHGRDDGRNWTRHGGRAASKYIWAAIYKSPTSNPSDWEEIEHTCNHATIGRIVEKILL